MRDMAPAQSTHLYLAIKYEASVLKRCNARVSEIIAAIAMSTCNKKALESSKHDITIYSNEPTSADCINKTAIQRGSNSIFSGEDDV